MDCKSDLIQMSCVAYVGPVCQNLKSLHSRTFEHEQDVKAARSHVENQPCARVGHTFGVSPGYAAVLT